MRVAPWFSRFAPSDSGDPILYILLKPATKYYNLLFVKYFGHAAIDWDYKTLRLVRDCKGVPYYWGTVHLIGFFGIGICSNIAGLFIEYKDQAILRRFICASLISASISLGGASFQLAINPKQVAGSINGILDFHDVLRKANLTSWSNFQAGWKSRLFVLGIGMNLSVFALFATYFASIVGLVLELDPLKYVIDAILPQCITINYNGVIILTRGVFVFSFLQPNARVVAFLFLYCLLTFQAYLLSLKMIAAPQGTHRAGLGEYRQLTLLHAGITPFSNRVNQLLMFLGHTTCVILFWLSIRAWSSLNIFFRVTFPLGAVVIMFWVLFILKILSCTCE